jgi:hypothetical protein
VPLLVRGYAPPWLGYALDDDHPYFAGLGHAVPTVILVVQSICVDGRKPRSIKSSGASGVLWDVGSRRAMA